MHDIRCVLCFLVFNYRICTFRFEFDLYLYILAKNFILAFSVNSVAKTNALSIYHTDKRNIHNEMWNALQEKLMRDETSVWTVGLFTNQQDADHGNTNERESTASNKEIKEENQMIKNKADFETSELMFFFYIIYK